MLGRIATAIIGEKIASRYGTGAKGALIGALVPTFARRALGPVGLVIGGAWAAKKYIDYRKAKRGGGSSADF